MQTEISVIDSDTPFQNVFQAISYYNHHRPGRLPSINWMERDKKSTEHGNVDLWSYLAMCVWRVSRKHRGTDGIKAFHAWYLTPRETKEAREISKKEIARKLGVTERTINRHLNRILVELEAELIDMRVVKEGGVA